MNNNHDNANDAALNIKKFFVLPFIHNVTKSATRLISKAVYNIGYRCIIKIYKSIQR